YGNRAPDNRQDGWRVVLRCACKPREKRREVSGKAAALSGSRGAAQARGPLHGGRMRAQPAGTATALAAALALHPLQQVGQMAWILVMQPQQGRGIVVGLLLEATRIGRLQQNARQDCRELGDLAGIAGNEGN